MAADPTVFDLLKTLEYISNFQALRLHVKWLFE